MHHPIYDRQPTLSQVADPISIMHYDYYCSLLWNGNCKHVTLVTSRTRQRRSFARQLRLANLADTGLTSTCQCRVLLSCSVRCIYIFKVLYSYIYIKMCVEETRHFVQCWGTPHTVRVSEQRGTHHTIYARQTTLLTCYMISVWIKNCCLPELVE